MKRTNTAAWIETSSRWQIKVQKDGIRKTFYSSKPGRDGQRECNAKADAWLDEGIVNTRVKVSDMAGKHMEQLRMTTSKSHWLQQEGYYNNWILPKIGKIKIENLSEQYLQSVINDAYKHGLAKKTLMNIKALMMAFLKFCRASRVTTLFVEGLFVPKGAQVKEKRILQPEDIRLLFSHDTTVDHKNVIVEPFIYAFRFEVLTGLRPGEIIGLKWSDIQDGVVYLSRSINVLREVTKGKNENARRSFGLNLITNTILEQQKQLLQESGITSEYVFPGLFGEAGNQSTYYKHWCRYRDYTGIAAKSSPYELRHTFVSIVKGMPEGYLKQMVGHSKDMDTYGIYSHEVDCDIEDSAQMVQDIFNKILQVG